MNSNRQSCERQPLQDEERFPADPKILQCRMDDRRLTTKYELVAHEEAGLQSLKYTWNHFYLPLFNASKDPSFSMPQHKVRQMFNNFEDLMAFQHRCVKGLQPEVASETGSFGQTLCKILGSEEFAKLYCVYASGYSKAVLLADKYSEKPDMVHVISREDHTLQSCLIGPLKRPLRLEGLLSSLIKRTPDTHPDYQHLVKLQESLKKLANSVNLICSPDEFEDDHQTHLILTVVILCSFVVCGFMWRKAEFNRVR